jgi:lipoprotein-anchoring transpeptidase ErfK/SrfK
MKDGSSRGRLPRIAGIAVICAVCVASPCAVALPQEYTPVHRAPRFLVVRLERGATLTLRARPRGPVVAHVAARTVFGSRTTLGVVRRAHGWTAVTAPELRNGRLGWFRTRGARVRWARTSSSITIDLSARRLEVRHGHRLVRRLTVGIGKAGTPTPRGRFAITDKLSGARFGPSYGRFILALSGRQTRGLADWPGPKRLAIHGTDAPGRIGARASFGCLIASDRTLARVIHEVRLGTPVIIKA